MKSACFAMAMILVVLCSCSPAAPPTLRSESGRHIYTNSKHGYEIRYPEGFDLWATGAEQERDGATIRVAFKDYAAPLPVLDIQVSPRTAREKFPSVDAQPNGMTVSAADVQVNGISGRQAQYRWTASGDLAFVEIYLEGVIFRFYTSTDIPDFQKTEWWAIISTFRFLDR
ncbi:MAG: hypothetical protein A2Z34_07145 [Planctomycetes bacterium RBG_16_59_8]|nr:MAG: hypothetical protein A2Z34_07145 [Planctomycetes bacterium RBG_16_59_8]